MKDRVKYLVISFLLLLVLFKASSACGHSQQEGDNLGATEAKQIAKTVSILNWRSLTELLSYLDRIRPDPVGAREKQELLADVLRANAQVKVTDQRRLSHLKARVEPALKLHHRSAVVELMIFKHPFPVIITKPGVVIAVSECLLDLIGDDDAALLGLVSHELAHEYVALAFYEATRLQRKARLQELELFCDSVAVASLITLNLDPACYASILQRMVNSSPEGRRLNDGSTAMPAIKTRLKLIGEMNTSLQRGTGK